MGMHAQLGVQYIGAPGRPPSEAEQTAEQTRSRIGNSVALRLKFVQFGADGAREDRAFNARARIDAFAGRDVVRSSIPCDEPAPQVACTYVEYTVPVNQKLLVNSIRAQRQDDRVVYSELSRSIFARRLVSGDTRNFPPIITDQETILEFVRSSESAVTGRIRLVSYLQPMDPLYFAANRMSVSISDYSIKLNKVK